MRKSQSKQIKNGVPNKNSTPFFFVNLIGYQKNINAAFYNTL